jgi:PAS domain S-box-containing protein
VAREWIAALGAAGAIAVAFFLAARLGLALLYAPSDLAVFWPASGIAAGIVIVLGRRAFPAVVIGVVVGTVAASLMSDRSLLTSLFNGFWNAGEALLVVSLLEWWFGHSFTFGGLRHVAGFLVAAGIATAASAIGGATTMTLLHGDTTAPYWHVWREWFLSSWVGLVVVAPLVIGLAQAWRKPPSREEWIEGLGVLGLTAMVCSYTIAQKAGSWLSFSPSAFVLPMLLWLTARCQLGFGIAGAFVASVAIICATTFGIGYFGDAAVPITQRVAGAQLAMMTVTLFTLVLVVLFTQRKEAEAGLRESEGRLAKKNAALTRLHEVGSRLWRTRDLGRALDEILAGAIELVGADMGVIRMLDTTQEVLKVEAHRGLPQEFLDSFGELPAAHNSACGGALRSGERRVVEDVETDALFAHIRPFASAAGYRAAQATPIISHQGRPLGLLSTHFRAMHRHADEDLSLLDLYVRQAADIIERHRAEDALRESEERLRERNAQVALVGSAALVGTFAYDVRTERTQVSEGYAAIHGLPEGTTEITRSQWRTRLHPEDVERMRVFESEAFSERRRECNVEYRIVRSDGGVRWIESRTFISFESDGQPQRVVGVNIDVTERKRAEEHQRALNAELDHRVKNVLATVSAIIGQTQEASRSPDDFVAGVRRRIQSLAGTHELLSRSNWHGVSLAQIIQRELAPYDRTNDIGGPSVTLKPEATQAVATVLHELTTNAAKYGAFANGTGRVSVQWRWLPNGSHGRLLIEWQETGGPPVLAPTRSGYGTSIIRELIPFELGGAVELSFAPEGTRCRLEIPGEWARKDVQRTKENRVSD